MLLFPEALLILAALGQEHRAANETIYPLNMAPDSVDDQYKGCTNEMTDEVEKYYLELEKYASPEFEQAWRLGENSSKEPKDNLKKNHLTAFHVYTSRYPKLYENFNEDVRDGMQNYENNSFKWYSLHFLLTEAIQILKKTQTEKCLSTFRGTNVQFYKNVSNKEIRFGHFTSSSLDRSVAEQFGKVSCFEIRTCEGADVANYSCCSSQKEVLIPPYEIFNITEVKRRQDQKDLWCDTVYVLNSTGKVSNMNCALFNSGNHVSDFSGLLFLTLLTVKL